MNSLKFSDFNRFLLTQLLINQIFFFFFEGDGQHNWERKQFEDVTRYQDALGCFKKYKTVLRTCKWNTSLINAKSVQRT